MAITFQTIFKLYEIFINYVNKRSTKVIIYYDNKQAKYRNLKFEISLVFIENQ